nr:MAG TPA: hypothetical protein [Caudoviricetes sp.]
MRSIPIPSAWQHSCRTSTKSWHNWTPLGYFWLTLQTCVVKANPLRRGRWCLLENCRSIKKFTWCMKRSSGKECVMG